MMRSRMCGGMRCWTMLAEEAGEGRGDGDQNPEQDRDEQAGDGGGFERDGDGVGLMEIVERAGCRGGRCLDAVEDGGGQQEGEDGERS